MIDLDALERLASEATPGPWESEEIKTEGGHGSYYAYCVMDAQGRSLFDTLNTDYRISTIHIEYDEDGAKQWDEPSRRNMDFVGACDPSIIKELIRLARIGQACEEGKK